MRIHHLPLLLFLLLLLLDRSPPFFFMSFVKIEKRGRMKLAIALMLILCAYARVVVYVPSVCESLTMRHLSPGQPFQVPLGDNPNWEDVFSLQKHLSTEYDIQVQIIDGWLWIDGGHSLNQIQIVTAFQCDLCQHN